MDFFKSIDNSWVDLFTNDAFIKQNDPTVLSNLIAKKKLPQELFWKTIHESTHHWCFDTSFGNTLFILLFDTYVESSSIRANEEEYFKWDILTNHLKYLVVSKLYRPLLEGIALFAEFDCIPSKTEALPKHIFYNMIWFSEQGFMTVYENQIDEIEKEYLNFILVKRFSQYGIDRKKNIFVKPLQSGKDCYLTGYLFVKMIHEILKEVGGLYDTNLFLYFLRNYFFNDLELVNILLDNDIKDEFVDINICNHFSERVAKLINVTPNDVKRFEKSILSDDKTYLDILGSKTKVQEGKKRLDEFYQGMINGYDLEELTLFSSFLFRRPYFKTTHLPGYLSIKDNRMVVYINYGFDNPIVNNLRKSDWPSRLMSDGEYYAIASIPVEYNINSEGKGTVEVLFNPRQDKFAQVFSLLDEVIHIEYSSNITDEDKNSFSIYYEIGSRGKEKNFTELVHSSIKNIYSNNPGLLTLHNIVLKKTEKFCQTIYTSKCLNCNDEFYDKNVKNMMTNGFYEILKNTKLLDQLVKYSIISSFSVYDKKTICELNNVYKLELETEPLELHKALRLNGFDYFFMEEDRIICRGL